MLLEESELRRFQRLARRQKVTTAEWVRQALRAAGDRQAATSATDKLSAVQRAAAHAYPTADIDRMLAEIERGYRSTDG